MLNPGDTVKIVGTKTRTKIVSLMLTENGINFWFVKNRVCAISEKQLIKIS